MSTTNVLTLEHLKKFNNGLYWIKKELGQEAPPVAIITGSSGPLELKDYFNSKTLIERDLSQGTFTLPRVEGHLPCIYKGEIENTLSVWVPGRTHFNEHGDAHDTVMMVRVLAQWGCRKFIITNLSGALDLGRHPVGSVCLVSDHIPFKGCNPLMGNPEILKQISGSSHRHLGMVDVYSKRIRSEVLSLKEIGNDESGLYPDIRLDAVYGMNCGPEFEGLAEKRDAIAKGILDLFGMSTVPEVQALAQMRTEMPDIEICALSMVSNEVAAFSLSHEQNLKAIKKESPKFARLIADLVPRLVA